MHYVRYLNKIEQMQRVACFVAVFVDVELPQTPKDDYSCARAAHGRRTS